jgi:phosphatidylinositol glycan class V
MPSQHTRDRGARDTLFIAALTASTFIISHSLLVCLSTLVPPFDVSHTINTSTSLPGLRWDAIHFLSIAKDGYEFEQQLAFQPGWQVILAAAGRAVARVGRGGDTVNDADLVQSALVINLIARVVANVYLYKCVSSKGDC